MSRFTRTFPALGAAAVLGIGGAAASASAGGGHRHAAEGSVQHAAKRAYSAADMQYLQTGIEGDRFEIAGGKLAQQKGNSQGVKAYGARLVTDHTKSLKDATALAKRLGIKVPTSPAPSMQWELQTVGMFSGAEFDTAYVNLEAMDHQQDISEARDEVKDGTNAAIRKSAKTEIPTLQQHLKLAQQLGGKTGTDPLGG